MEMDRRALARLIDHTCLAPDSVAARIDAACDEAVEHGMRICVAPVWVPRAVARVRGRVEVVSVVDFPHGTSTPETKRAAAREIMRSGATEADMVIHVGALKSGDDDAVLGDIRGVAEVVHERTGGILKVILETALLSPGDIVRACELAVRAGADFVKTSTGFTGAGATVEAVRLMRANVPDRVGVKASGGIRDYGAAMAMIAAGATRIGASASLDILRGAPDRTNRRTM